jgi:hypothetical protein
VQTGKPVLKSSIQGVSFPQTSVVVLDPVDGIHNTFGSFVVETVDAMRAELYRVFQVFFFFLSFRSSVSSCFQVARHTSRILPLSGDAADDIDAASAPVLASSVSALSSDVTTGDVAAAAVAVPASSMFVPKTPAAVVPGISLKYAPSSIPPNVLAELQVCSVSTCVCV